MIYKVMKNFTDLQDQNHFYEVGDIYPREGVNVSASRIKELSGTNNRQHMILIKAEEEPVQEAVKVTRKRKKSEG